MDFKTSSFLLKIIKGNKNLFGLLTLKAIFLFINNSLYFKFEQISKPKNKYLK